MEIKEFEPIAPHTIYKIGGTVRYFIEAHNADEVKSAVRFARERDARFFILGAGSNLLVSDNGFDGVVIHMIGGDVRTEDVTLTTDAGVMMARAVLAAKQANLEGFEWGIGVPGTIGGSVRGNAGCFGGEMKDVVSSVTIYDTALDTTYALQNSDCAFGYRHSVFKAHPEWVILSATLSLKSGDARKIQERIREYSMKRTSAQDVGTKCAGCIFKNTAWERIADTAALLARFPDLERFRDSGYIPTSYLIDQTGLKGRSVGSIAISERHANFFINNGGGTALDVRALISITKEAVRERYGIVIEEEIFYLE